MEEREIIKSEKYNITLFRNIMLVIGVMIAVYCLAFEVYLDALWRFLTALIFGGPFIIVGLLFYSLYSCVELTVTNKRVFGTAVMGRRVDLPVDSISAIGTHIFKGIAITTSSGAIKFGMIKNRDEIHSAISKLLVNRQTPASPQQIIRQEIPQSNADELKKFKELLDSGIITQEEFDAKKKQLLGL